MNVYRVGITAGSYEDNYTRYSAYVEGLEAAESLKKQLERIAKEKMESMYSSYRLYDGLTDLGKENYVVWVQQVIILSPKDLKAELKEYRKDDTR